MDIGSGCPLQASLVRIGVIMPALMWFRSDLRVQDNTALHHACKGAGDGVVGIFNICPKQWMKHDWGRARVDFVLRNVRELSENLAKLNIPLLIIRCEDFADSPKKLLAIARRHKCTSLYFNQEYEINEQSRDREVTELFEKHALPVHAYTDQVIIKPDGIRTKSGGVYSVFTPFKRSWCAVARDTGLPRKLTAPGKQKPLKIEADHVPLKLPGFAGQAHSQTWPAGEWEGGKRLKKFIASRIDSYHRDRDYPCINGTSTLSPYLAAGVISPRAVMRAAVDANGGKFDSGRKGVVTWISELIWREFYRYILVGYPWVGRDKPFKAETDDLPWSYDESHFAAWCEGRTGYPLVDAGMRQLTQTGWMHNRLRMVVAMFLTKDLFIDWRWGERFFMQNLVDGDFASNNGGWQWSASTGTDAAPYFRFFNPYTQSKRYDPKGLFIRRYVKELAVVGDKDVHCPIEAVCRENGYPTPIINREQTRGKVVEAFTGISRRKPRNEH